MPRKKKKNSRMYFTQDTENAIVRYNKSDDTVLKNKIYEEHIEYPFDKLVENIIHTFKFYYFDVPSEQVKHEVVSFLVLNIHKFKEGRGKAFSYFSIVAKNYLILHNNSNYKKMKSHDDLIKLDYVRDIRSERDKTDFDESNKEFVIQLLEYWDNNITNIFKRQKDILVADAVLELFRKIVNIENFNKKALYIMIREMTDVKTSKITQISNVFRKIYPKIQQQVISKGHIDNLINTGSL